MEDEKIVDLYWARDESAIRETQQKYGNYCYKIAWNILFSREDSEECVNDTYFRAWNAMPAARPGRLMAFLGKITRNIALDRYEKEHAQKRGEGQVALALEELQNCVPDRSADGDEGATVGNLALRDVLNVFLRSLSEKNRGIFLQRYWYLLSVKEIAEDFGMSESAVKMSLKRTKDRLRRQLKDEGIFAE